VAEILAEMTRNGEAAVQFYARKFDDWNREFILTEAQKKAQIAELSSSVKRDIDFAHEQITAFARKQKESLHSFEFERNGVILGQKVIPVDCAGCYVPGGRYAHVASALMSIATAKIAGVPYIIAASPPRDGNIHPATIYAMDAAGADMILQMGGVHAIASLARGLFTQQPADIIVGPGNAYVAEAKRILFGEVGIDIFAGPTESAIIADHSADPLTIAIDLVSQAEHGPQSPVWLFTTDTELGKEVIERMPELIEKMPNSEVCLQAWQDCGEVIVAESREEVARISDRYAPEHLQVMAGDIEWWKTRLRNYGSLFLGEGSTVTHGYKCSGPNHILPTKKAARYSGGLNVQKFMKILTYQELTAEANRTFSPVASRISRLEGMEGHARACDWRLEKFFPDKTDWDFPVYRHKS
ncbi:MAG: histidinol dehydrogenase, partial [Spirochaetota bacterium]